MTRLCRALDGIESMDAICWIDHCTARPQYRIDTPHGRWDACDAHSDELLALLPTEWIAAWKALPSDLLAGLDDEDIPF